MGRNVTASLIGSIVFHAALFAAYLHFFVLAPQKRLTVIGNVDLLMPEKARPVQVKTSAPSTWNFLKLAIPQVAAPRPLDKPLEVKTRDVAKEMKLPEKLLERSGKVMSPESLKMDAGRRVSSGLENLSAEIKSQRSEVALAPRIDLEEVGERKAPSIPGDIRFDDNAAPMRPQSVQEVSSAIAEAKRASSMPAPILAEEAAPRRAAWTSGAAGLPGKQVLPGQQMVQGPALRKQEIAPVLAPRNSLRSSVLRDAGEKKGVEIEGPLAGRKVAKAYVPEFPAWAREKGILEASVSIRFYVDSSGRVADPLRVERTSGYGALDRLAVESLRRWLFVPLSSSQKQWGIITFRFLTE